MRFKLFIVLFFFFDLSQSYAQGICDDYQPGFVTAEIVIPDTAVMSFNGQVLPIGSIIIAVDQDGNCCAEPVVWMEQEISIEINGQAGGIIGYQNGEVLGFLVSEGDSCFTMATNVLFDNDEPAFFESDEVFTLSSFEAFQSFELGQIEIQNTKCDSVIGSILLDVTGGSEPFTYEWSHDSLLMDDLASELMEGTYEYTITDENGCTISDSSVVINAFDFPEFDFQIDSMASECDTIVVTDVADCNNCSYLWFDSLMVETRNFTEAGIFTVSISNGECMGLDTVEIGLLDRLEISAMVSESEVCMGDTVMMLGSGALSYIWNSDADIINAMDSVAEAVILDSTIIEVIGMDACFSDTLLLEVVLFPMPSAGDSLCGALGNNSVQLLAMGAEDYMWEDNPLGPVSDAAIPDPTVSPSESTYYFVNMIDENGCESRDSVFVEIIDDIENAIPLYNLITPNGDGRNDLLIFDKLETVLDNSLLVYDRWGKIVFETENYQNDWGGTRDGDPLPGGTYYYILTLNGQIFKSNLTILYE
jgi:gliding motility-associated-like protein